MNFYSLAGIRLEGDDRWYIRGKFLCRCNDSGNSIISSIIMMLPEFQKLITPILAELSMLGFSKNITASFEEPAIYIYAHSHYDDRFYAVITIDDNEIKVDIIDSCGYMTLEKFKKTYAHYMRVIKSMHQLHGIYLKQFKKLLPQPIAEEIAAEFIHIPL